jgi:succinate-acetate transporter protein
MPDRFVDGPAGLVAFALAAAVLSMLAIGLRP